jgi:hypothetical protein
MAKAEIEAFMAENEITIDAVFVPFSQSRNKAEKNPSLNWVVTVKHRGRPICFVDFTSGSGICPANKSQAPIRWPYPKNQWKWRAIAWECENGYPAEWNAYSGDFKRVEVQKKGRAIKPEKCDVLYSLASESDALNYSTFEDWAGCFGYDPDSRKGEKIYRECLEIALKIRGALGETGLAALQQACEDY